CSRGRADGALVLWLLPTQRLMERLSAAPFPVVLLNVVDPHMWSVAVDHDAAARSAVEYCIGIGHRRIALVDRPVDVFDSASAGICGRGYRETMSAAEFDPPDGYEHMAELSQSGGAQALEAFMVLREPPTAIVAASDVQAIGLLLAARERGWRVPGDLSIVGYSDSPNAEYLGLPPLDVPLREIRRAA